MKLRLAVALIALTVVPTLAAYGGQTDVLVDATKFTRHAAADTSLGDFYVLNFDVPAEAKPLGRVYLEFYVDVAARTVDGGTNDTPVIEVYALKSAFSGDVNANEVEAYSRPMVKNVLIGPNRRVVLDITQIAESYVADPSRNYGVIVGSLTRSRDGLFTLRTDAYEGKGVGKITFLK